MPSKRSPERSKKTPGRGARAPAGTKFVESPSADSISRAGAVVAAYRFIIERRESGRYVGMTVELPGAIGTGRTPEECYATTLRSQTVMAASMLERGQVLPPAALDARREAQINIRVTDFEKLQLEAAAQRQGFRSVSDFLRAAGLGVSRAG